MISLHPANSAFVMFLTSINLKFIPVIVTPKTVPLLMASYLYYYPSWSSLVF